MRSRFRPHLGDHFGTLSLLHLLLREGQQLLQLRLAGVTRAAVLQYFCGLLRLALSEETGGVGF